MVTQAERASEIRQCLEPYIYDKTHTKLGVIRWEFSRIQHARKERGLALLIRTLGGAIAPVAPVVKPPLVPYEY